MADCHGTEHHTSPKHLPASDRSAPGASRAWPALPEGFRRDLERAVEILTDCGCHEVYLFGSLAHGRSHHASDIDLAIRGCRKGEFFSAYGRLMVELEHPIDLVSLEYQREFADYLVEHGELLRIA